MDNSSAALNSRCWYRALDEIDLAKAEAECAAAIKLDPEIAAYWDSYALVALRTARLDEALARYNRALKLNPNQPASQYGRGIVQLRRGDKSAAALDMAAAKSIDPNVDGDFNAAGIRP